MKVINFWIVGRMTILTNIGVHTYIGRIYQSNVHPVVAVHLTDLSVEIGSIYIILTIDLTSIFKFP